MGDHTNEEKAAALMGQLLIKLAQREDIKRKLGELNPENSDDLIRDLLDEFGVALEQRVVQMLVEERMKKNPPGKLTLVTRSDTGKDEAPPPRPSERLRTVPPEIVTPPPKPVAPPPPPHRATERPPSQSPSRSTAREEEKPLEKSPLKDKAIRLTETMKVPPFLLDSTKPSGPPPVKPPPPKAEPPERRLEDSDRRLFGGEEPLHPSVKPKLQRIRVELTDDDHLYLHGFCAIPSDQEPALMPFMLEEKGIEEKDFACAVDLDGIRVYLTRLQGVATNVSGKGLLLLNKQDSVRWRGVHESILNDLRIHGNLVPFAFGTVALGFDDLRTKVQMYRAKLADALDDMQETSWWNLGVHTLDARMAQLVGTDGATPRQRGEVNRQSYAIQSQGVKLDIKALERILGKQKKIAESIHEDLAGIADRSDIDFIIGLGGGTSDDWKVILKASYEVPPSRQARFHSMVSESQYRHMLFEIMLKITGNVESFSFQEDEA